MNRSDSGFTLFEVLAAVALLAFFYTMLSTVAIRGLRSEGRSRQLMEASLLADVKLAEMEVELDRGIVPEIGFEEMQEEPFVVSVEVSAFSIEIPETGATLDVTPGGGSPQVSELLGNLTPEESPIRQIVLTVTWMEGSDPMSTSRTTYGVDPVALQEASARLAAAAASGTGSTTGINTGTGVLPETPERRFGFP